MKLAANIASGPHAYCYDNINISTSIFVEQRGPSGPAKVQSGTFSVLYELRDADPAHMRILPMMQRLKNAPPLTFKDILPTNAQSKSLLRELKVTIVNTLIIYCSGFKDYGSLPELQHRCNRRIPDGYKTKQYPMRVTTTEEATIRDNLIVHDDAFITQLKQPVPDLCILAKPSFNDQKTNASI